jgi:molybdopterin-guanine dinucleotide biosynthesis protein A
VPTRKTRTSLSPRCGLVRGTVAQRGRARGQRAAHGLSLGFNVQMRPSLDIRQPVVGCLLAGGASTRLGRAKPGVLLAGRPLIEYPTRAFAGAGIEAVVMAKPSTPLPELGLSVWKEPAEPSHPLLGIVTALEWMQRSTPAGAPDALVVCPCDLPFVPPSLLVALAEMDAPIAVPRFGGRLHPLLGRYGFSNAHPRSLLDELRSALERGDSMHSVVERLDPVLIEGEALAAHGDPNVTLFNVNTPDDLQRAEEIIRQRH